MQRPHRESGQATGGMSVKAASRAPWGAGERAERAGLEACSTVSRLEGGVAGKCWLLQVPVRRW